MSISKNLAQVEISVADWFLQAQDIDKIDMTVVLQATLVSGIAKVSSPLAFCQTHRTVLRQNLFIFRKKCTATMDGDVSTMSEKVQNMEQLKPIHIVVMVLTLLHAIAIAVWSFVFLTGSKSEFQAPLAMHLCFYA